MLNIAILIGDRLNDPAFDLDEQRLNSVYAIVYQSRPIWLPKIA